MNKKNDDILGEEDPNFNQGVMIEIFDNKRKHAPQQEVSLAEMFKAKKKEAILKFDNRKQQEVQQDDEA